MARSRKTPEKDVIKRLAGAGEGALQRLNELPGGKALLKAMGDVREALDEMAMRLRAVDPLERRVTALEKRLAALEKPKAASRARTTRKTTTRRKPKTTASSGGNAQP